MGYFDGMDLSRLFDDESEYGKNFVFGDLTDEQISRAEETIGYKFPESYKELLRFRNGGCISDELDERWIDAIYGVAPDPDNYYGLESMYDNWRNEWEYPDIGIPFGETQSAGHDMYYMDFSVTDENGEPRIVRIDNECDNRVFIAADNLPEFIRLTLDNVPPEEFETPEKGPEDEDPPVKEAPKKNSLFSKLLGR